MDAWIYVAVVVVLFLGWRYWKRAQLAGARAVALSEYSKQFPLLDARRIHDMALTYLATSIQQDRDPYQDFEIVIALRDRVDQLEHRDYGPGNKVRIRTKIAPAVTRLFKEENPLAALNITRPFLLGEDTPDIEHRRLNLHLQMMQRIYQHLHKASRMPELDALTNRQ